MSKAVKTPATVSMTELTDIAARASRRAGEEARAAGIHVAGIDVPETGGKKNAAVKKPAKQRV